MTPELAIAFQTDKSASEYVSLAQFIDPFNFDVVSVYHDLPFHPGYAALLLMAPHLHNCRVGIASAIPSRMHPIDIAANTALLADLVPDSSSVYIGLARGAWLSAHGISERKPALTAIRESVDIIRYMLSGQTRGYNGKVFQLAEHVRTPYPTPEKIPRLMIGTWGKKLSAIAGEIADEVKIGGSANPDVVPAIKDYIAVGENNASRQQGSVGVVMGAVCVVDEDRDAARAKARREVALYLPVVADLDPTIQLDPHYVTRLQAEVERNDFDAAAKLISDEMLDKFAFSGNADDLIAQSHALLEAGTHRIDFGTPHGLNPEIGIRILGETVLPELRKHWV
ncbi:MAG: LLM class flavin-dependent oxidoreductase [Chloroflexota bacterium]